MGDIQTGVAGNWTDVRVCGSTKEQRLIGCREGLWDDRKSLLLETKPDLESWMMTNTARSHKTSASTFYNNVTRHWRATYNNVTRHG